MFVDYAKIVIKSGDGGNGAEICSSRWTGSEEMVEMVEVSIL